MPDVLTAHILSVVHQHMRGNTTVKEVKVDGHLIQVLATNTDSGELMLTVDEADQLMRDLKPAIIKARIAEKLLAKDSLKTAQDELVEKMRELENLKRRVGQLREKSK
jgi:hypothetical protein